MEEAAATSVMRRRAKEEETTLLWHFVSVPNRMLSHDHRTPTQSAALRRRPASKQRCRHRFPSADALGDTAPSKRAVCNPLNQSCSPLLLPLSPSRPSLPSRSSGPGTTTTGRKRLLQPFSTNAHKRFAGNIIPRHLHLHHPRHHLIELLLPLFAQGAHRRSAGYGNYRHQADACHAYQVVTAGGIKPENVILLAVDDIANYRTNPFPGQVFNKPTDAGTPGVDVYDGCVIDYKGSDVTPETFTKVLTGDDSAGGKVLKSGADDRVFVNFVDHGAVGLIGFPTSQMHATELLAALQKMHDASMYKELVFYLEACESGSMFANLPANMNIYATTAANGKESSWGTYCMPDDKVDGKEIHSCLGDLYSVNWMEDTDKGMASEV